MIIEIVGLDERMGHLDAFGLHRVLLAEVVVRNRVIIQIAYLTHCLSRFD